MAALVASDIQKAWRELVEAHLAPAGPVNLSKTELAAAVATTNTWIDNNLASGAPAANTALNANQKAMLFVITLMVKYGKL